MFQKIFVLRIANECPAPDPIFIPILFPGNVILVGENRSNFSPLPQLPCSFQPQENICPFSKIDQIVYNNTEYK